MLQHLVNVQLDRGPVVDNCQMNPLTVSDDLAGNNLQLMKR